MAGSRAPFVAVRTDIRKEERVRFIADHAGYNDDEAIGKLVRLWCWCTDRNLQDAPDDCDGYAVPDAVVRRFLGPRGVEAMLGDGCDELAMGARRPDGLIYLRGTADTVERLRSLRALSRAGGQARNATGQRAAGRFVSDGTIDQPTAGGVSPHVSVMLDTKAPAESQPAPARSQIPDPEDQNSLSRAIPPRVPPAPPATPPPAPSAPAPAPAPPGESAWHRRQRWWAAMLEADARIRACGIEPSAPSLPKSPAGIHETNMHRCERQLIDGGLSPDEVDQRMRHIVAVAETEAIAKRKRAWFLPALIWDPERAARAADTSLAQAAALPQPRLRGGFALAPPPLAPRRRPDPPPALVTDEERAGAEEQLAAAKAMLGIRPVPVSQLPTEALVRMFGAGGGERAPPAAVSTDEPTDRDHDDTDHEETA